MTYVPDSDEIFDQWHAVQAFVRDDAEKAGMSPREAMEAWRIGRDALLAARAVQAPVEAEERPQHPPDTSVWRALAWLRRPAGW
jgi:hypothetical protein